MPVVVIIIRECCLFHFDIDSLLLAIELSSCVYSCFFLFCFFCFDNFHICSTFHFLINNSCAFLSVMLRLQQAMEERYKLCDDGMARLLVWISNVEAQLANQDTVREDVAELKNQINVIRV